MSEPLAQALRISGASMIMLTSIESRTTVWSAGPARVGADVAALGAAITEAAAEMVRLTAAGVEMDDLLVTSPANFHVLRVVDGQVAHLVLDRGSANLAMARREFRQMVERRPAGPRCRRTRRRARSARSRSKGRCSPRQILILYRRAPSFRDCRNAARTPRGPTTRPTTGRRCRRCRTGCAPPPRGRSPTTPRRSTVWSAGSGDSE